MASSPITSWQIDGETVKTVTNFILGGSTADGDCSYEIKRCLLLGRKAMTNLTSILKSRDITFLKVHIIKAKFFSSGHVWMWELDHKESWALKNCCFWTVVLEKTLSSLLDCKQIQPVNPKGNQSWIFIGMTDAETPILWPPDAKNCHIWKKPDTGKDWRQEEKGTTEDEMVGWYHQLDGHDFEQALGVGDGQGSLPAVVRGFAERQTQLSDWTDLSPQSSSHQKPKAWCRRTWILSTNWFQIFTNMT